MPMQIAEIESKTLLEARPKPSPDALADEAILIKEAKIGNAEAFGRLYLMHLDAIYRYVYFRVADARDAEDLTEQVFLKAWQALPGYKQRGKPFTSWLYRIAHNTVVDHHRRRQSAPSLPLSESVEWHTSKDPSALQQIIRAEEMQTLAWAISQLSEEQQQVIILRFIEDLSHAEVADIMDKSEGACRVIQHRALTALNQLLTGARGK